VALDADPAYDTAMKDQARLEKELADLREKKTTAKTTKTTLESKYTEMNR
jgi:hypothetical protein